MPDADLKTIAHRLASRHGIIAVLTAASEAGKRNEFSAVAPENQDMHERLVLIAAVYRSFGAPKSFRLAIERADDVGEITVAVRQDGDVIVVVAYTTAHPISKSIARMTRRAVAGSLRAEAA